MTKDVQTQTLTAVTDSVKAAPWLTSTDIAAVQLAQTIAAEIDIALATGESDRIIALAPRLLDVLKQLHLTPETRTQGKQQDEIDGSNHIGNYLRLLASPDSHAKSGTAKRRASRQ